MMKLQGRYGERDTGEGLALGVVWGYNVGVIPPPNYRTLRTVTADDGARVGAAQREAHVGCRLRVLRIEVVVLIEHRLVTPEHLQAVHRIGPNEPSVRSREVVIQPDALREGIRGFQHVH